MKHAEAMAKRQEADADKDNDFLWQIMDDLGAVFRECINHIYDHVGGLPGLYQLSPEQFRFLEESPVVVYCRCKHLTTLVERDTIRRTLMEAVSVVLGWQESPEKVLTRGEANEAIIKMQAVGALFADLIYRYHDNRREREAHPAGVPSDLVLLKIILQDFFVSESTIKRHIKSRLLRSYPIGKKGVHRVSYAAAKALYRR